MRLRSLTVAALVASSAAVSFARGFTGSVSATLSLEQPAAGGAGGIDTATEPRSTLRFGAQGQSHWLVYSGAAVDIEEDDDTVDVPLTIGYSRFIVDDLEFSAELTLWGHFQDGDDAAGFNPGFNLRWHYLNRDRWTLFADAGIGVIATTDNVPEGGTGFNFTPRAGLGATLRLTDAGVRLLGGVRWHHISNARINGESRNPDRDGVLAYVGVMVPF